MVTIDFTFFKVSGYWYIQNNSTLDWFEKGFAERSEAMKFLFEYLLKVEEEWH